MRRCPYETDIVSDHQQYPRIHVIAWENGRHFADGVLKYSFQTDTFWIRNTIPLKYVPHSLI